MSHQQQRPLAVVTGASSGIGFELPKVFAEEGFDLLITAEDEEIQTAQRELNQLTAGVECTRQDLSTGVTVTSLMPGPTETEFFERADMLDTPVGEEDKDDPAEVARQGYQALMAGREKVVGGSFKNKAQTVMGKVVPDSVKAEMHGRMAEPATAKEDR